MVVAAGCKCCWARRGDQVGSLGDEVEGGSFSQVLVLGAKQPCSPDRRSQGQSPEISLWGAWRGCTWESGSLGVVGQGPGGRWPSSERRKGG